MKFFSGGSVKYTHGRTQEEIYLTPKTGDWCRRLAEPVLKYNWEMANFCTHQIIITLTIVNGGRCTFGKILTQIRLNGLGTLTGSLKWLLALSKLLNNLYPVIFYNRKSFNYFSFWFCTFFFVALYYLAMRHRKIEGYAKGNVKTWLSSMSRFGSTQIVLPFHWPTKCMGNTI